MLPVGAGEDSAQVVLQVGHIVGCVYAPEASLVVDQEECVGVGDPLLGVVVAHEEGAGGLGYLFVAAAEADEGGVEVAGVRLRDVWCVGSWVHCHHDGFEVVGFAKVAVCVCELCHCERADVRAACEAEEYGCYVCGVVGERDGHVACCEQFELVYRDGVVQAGTGKCGFRGLQAVHAECECCCGNQPDGYEDGEDVAVHAASIGGGSGYLLTLIRIATHFCWVFRCIRRLGVALRYKLADDDSGSGWVSCRCGAVVHGFGGGSCQPCFRQHVHGSAFCRA